MKKTLTSISLLIALALSGCSAPFATPAGTSSMNYNSAQKLAVPMAAPGAMAELADGQVTSDQAQIIQQGNTEEYDRIYENAFLEVTKNPLSTFSIDVDSASYSNLRRFISYNQLPPKDAVRIEEMINYFDYDYPQPEGNDPFSINLEMSQCPWNKENKLINIGLQGREVSKQNFPPGNLVFLIDVSGSMGVENKLPLLKSSLKLLVNELREEDKVSIVTYAGNAGLALPATSGKEKQKIISAIDRLESGGSTPGGAGIELAYKIAKENFMKNGNNRVILSTDGDFNVGASSDAELVRMIEEKRDYGIFLSVLGFGMGNYKDSKMEQLADKGNGNYAYIDTLQEAKKVLVKQMGGTLFTIAKDVKLQLEFNPTKVKAYRLIGYENRVLKNEDFNDDKKDAGELGSGHKVTALYEIIPVGSDVKLSEVDPLKYQDTVIKTGTESTNEIMTVKFRYKEPKEDQSKLISKILEEKTPELSQTSNNFRFSAAVASFGMLVRDSQYKGNSTIESITSLANSSKGTDKEGYRSEFVKLVQDFAKLKK